MSNIEKRKGSRYWWFRIQRNGRTVRQSLKTTDKAVAEKRARKKLDKLDATLWGDKPERTYKETSDRFIKEYLPELKPKSAERYGYSLEHLAEHFDGKKLAEITKSTLAEFVAKRAKEGVKPATIRRDLFCLSCVLREADEWEWFEGRNEALAFLHRRKKRGVGASEPRTRYLSVAEERALLSACEPDFADIVTLAIDTGLRRDELFSLTWQQIDMLRGTIVTTTKTKSGKARRVPITARSAQILSQLPRYIACPYVLVNPETVLPEEGKPGTRYVHRNKSLKGAMKKAGIQDLRWHDLRRTAGCRWLQRDGKTMEEVSMLLGHSSVKVTETVYAFLEPERVAESGFDRTQNATWDSAVISLRK